MKLLFDFLPLLVFYAAFQLYGIYIATAVGIVASVVQVSFGYFKHRRFEPMHLVVLAAMVVFGGLTIALQDEAFIKWKPSIVNWVFAAAVLGSLFGKKSALEFLMGKQFKLPAAVWRKLNIAWASFFVAMGCLNVYVAFYYNLDADAAARTQTWVNFKVFGLTAMTFVFAIAQFLFIAKHIPEEND